MENAMPFQLAIVCGGPSLERGISLNSARTLLDHLRSKRIEIEVFYIDQALNAYALNVHQLYSNTPADFDFKIHQVAQSLSNAKFIKALGACDLIFPCIHGEFGETGDLQALLESAGLPYVGSSSAACKSLFYKHKASQVLKENGFEMIPHLLLKKGDPANEDLIKAFFETHALNKAIVKPSAGGSSIGVKGVMDPQQALEHAKFLFTQNIDRHALVEPFLEGQEFTIMVLVNHDQEPYALMPSEITIQTHGAIFDYRRKYLPTANTFYHTPARFSEAISQSIRRQAVEVFKLFEMRDFGRLDGWVLPNGKIVFTDLNPITGMEQNSFLFRQASLMGQSHGEVLKIILRSACQRYQIPLPEKDVLEKSKTKKPIHILMGGQTAERQVSLMSGTNVWLKLLKSEFYDPKLFFWGPTGKVWQLPYSYALNHTVEEVEDNCYGSAHAQKVLQSLFKNDFHFSNDALNPLKGPFDLQDFINNAQSDGAFVFIALHGGAGEGGALQAMLDAKGVPYNGSKAEAAQRCMDKYETALCLEKAQIHGIEPLKKFPIETKKLLQSMDFERLWASIQNALDAEAVIIKPRSDGCSAGVVPLKSAQDLTIYFKLLETNVLQIPEHTLSHQTEPIVLPTILPEWCLFEPYIETDRIRAKGEQLRIEPKQGWVELTVGVLEEQGLYRSFLPSITVAEGSILSLEEKFQSGTGINLTPPPIEVLNYQQIKKIQHMIEQVAKVLEIENYARIDVFFNRHTDALMVIEANTLPALTASTVLYHQALAEEPPMNPLMFLEQVIEAAWEKHTAQASLIRTQQSTFAL
jgi:D-alanine--D-alanine ligase